MRKNNVLSSEEWENIIEDAFNSDEKHIFSERYEMQKKVMMQSDAVHNKSFAKIYIPVIVVLALIPVIVPTSIYAYNRIRAHIGKTAPYRNTATIISPTTENTQTNSEKKYMKHSFGWLPEGYIRSTEKQAYYNASNGNSISFQLYKLPENTKLKIDFLYSENCENYRKDDKVAIINYKYKVNSLNTNLYTKEAIITFDNSDYMLDLIFTDNITREEILKIIDNLSLVPSDEKVHGDYIPWLDQNNQNTFSSSSNSIIREEGCKNVGDTIHYTDLNIDVTLNSAEITDSFNGITTDGCGNPIDYSNCMDDNGNILSNKRTYIKRGDGINTIDEIIKEENIPIHLLKINATYKNTGTKTEDITIYPCLFVSDNGHPLVYWESCGETKYHDSILGLSYQSDMLSMDVSPEYKGEKNSILLEPNESADVQIVFLVAEDVRNKINISFINGSNRFTEYFDVSG